MTYIIKNDSKSKASMMQGAFARYVKAKFYVFLF